MDKRNIQRDSTQHILCLYDICRWSTYFLNNLVQMLSLTLYAGKVLRKNLKRALPDLIHVVVIAFAISFITEYTDWYKVDRYYNHLLFCIGFMVVRNTMYMQLCVVT